MSEDRGLKNPNGLSVALLVLGVLVIALLAVFVFVEPVGVQPDLTATAARATETLQPGPIAHLYRGSGLIPCRVEVDARQPRTAIVGGEQVTLTTLSVALPLEVCPVKDEVVTIMSARIDQALIGRRFDVKAADIESYALERRVLIVEHL